MFEIETYDTLVIGSGEAGKYLAWTMAKAGRRTAVVRAEEHRRLLSEHRLWLASASEHS